MRVLQTTWKSGKGLDWNTDLRQYDVVVIDGMLMRPGWAEDVYVGNVLFIWEEVEL